MIITSHTGAENTNPNSIEYLEKMREYNIDAIEMDIRKRGHFIYCSHNRTFKVKDKLPLEYVLDYVVERNIMINLDLKQYNIVKHVQRLVREHHAENNVYFTGSVASHEFKYLGDAKVYLNHNFFRRRCMLTVDNLEKIKEYIYSFNSPSVGGINIYYRFASEEFLAKCKEIGLPVSLWTIDNEKELTRLLAHEELVNVTTRNISKALEIYNK